MKPIRYLLLIVLAIPFCIFAQGITIGSGATISLGSAILTLPSNWNNAGTFVPGIGTVVLNGATDQTITNASGETFLDLNINKASGIVVLNNNITINGNLTLTGGDLDLDGDTVTLGPSAILNETAGNTVKGTSGVIMTTRTLGANPGNVGGLGTNIKSSPALGVTTILRGHRPDTVGTSNSVCRYYAITPTNNSGLNANVSFHYDHSEMNNLTESVLGLYNSTDNGTSWNLVTGTLDTATNDMVVTGVNSFSKWSLFSSTNPPVSVETKEELILPKVYALYQNYPNPFNPATTISFDLPMQSYVRLTIFDVIGREVATLADEELVAGSHLKIWNASSFSSGVYFYRLDAHSSDGDQDKAFTSTKKILLVK